MPESILLFHTDQHRADSLGCGGNTICRTPNLDALAARGVLFANAFTPIAICAPARASLLTGLYPMRHGVINNPEFDGERLCRFRGNPPIYSQLLRGRGYRCAYVGKWHVTIDTQPSDLGFEGAFYPGYGEPQKHEAYLSYLRERGLPPYREEITLAQTYDGRPSEFPLLGQLPCPPECAIPYFLAEQAIDFLRQFARTRERFHLRVDFWGPHLPYFLPEPYFSMYDPQQIPPWPNFAENFDGKPRIQSDYLRYWGIDRFTWKEWAPQVAGFYGAVTEIDAQIGRVLEALRELGLEADTAVFFTADHGEMTGSHRLPDKGPYMYDEIYRVPLIAACPGRFPGRARVEDFVYNMDLMPTFLELAGIPAPEGIDAVSLLPQLTGRPGGRKDDVVISEFEGHQIPFWQRMVRSRTHKYIFNGTDVDELYDLTRDPGELVNRIDDPACAEVRRDLKARLLAWMQRCGDPLLKYYALSRMRPA